MNSTEDIDLILTTLSASSNDDFLRQFKECHVKFFDKLKSEDDEHQSRILEFWRKYCKISLESDLSCGPSEHLSSMLPRLSSFVTELVAEIDILLSKNRQTETLTNVTKAWQQIIHVLEPLNLWLKEAVPNCQPSLGENISFILHFGDILITIFQHCQNHKTTYSDVPPSVSQHVSSVLKTCNEIHNQYLHFVQSSVLNSEDTDDLDRLIEVIRKLFLIGVAVSSLDVKTMALLWKSFLNLLELHAVHLRSKFNLSPVIEFFCKEIIDKTKSLYESTDTSYRNLTLKISCFMMKIIVKLCSYWSEHLEKFISPLLRLIFFLYDHSIACSKYSTVHIEIIEEIDRSLLAGVDSLISVLVNDCSFIRFYALKYVRKIIGIQNETGPLLLLCTILQKLISCAEDIQDLWLQHSVLDVCLTMISAFHKTLAYEIRLPSNFLGNPKLSREVLLYDTLLVNVSSLIISDFSGVFFDTLEVTLITHFLRASILVKIFISDLWCIIDRYGDSELCFTHINYLQSVLKELQNGKIEAVLLLWLVRRLFKFLSPKQQVELLEIAGNDSLLENLYELADRRIIEKAAIEVQHLKRSYKNSMTFNERLKLLRSVTVTRKCDVAADGEFDSWMKDSFLIEQWSFIIELILRLEDLDRTADFIFHLSCATSFYIATLSPSNVLQLLKLVNDLLTCDSNLVLVNIQKVLKACGPIRFSNSCARECSTLLVSLFSTCLRSRNSIVKQYSLESFSYFCHITVHDTIIQETIGSDLKLKETLALYLQKNLRKPVGEKTIKDFISNLPLDETAKIDDKILKTHTDEYSKPKKIKLQQSIVLVKMNEIENVLDELMNTLCGTDALEEDEKIKLCKLLDKLDEFRKFV